MASYIQHFVSQHLGRGVGKVEFDAQGKGVATLDFPQLSMDGLAYSFVADEVLRRYPGQSALEPLVLRLAIGQAQRDFRKGGIAPGPQELAPGVAPWLGDFADGPFGGATVGYLRRGGVTDERRQGNHRLEAKVDQGLFMRKKEGRRAARCYLELASVPEAIIRRVLSHTAQRRKTRIAPVLPDADEQALTEAN